MNILRLSTVSLTLAIAAFAFGYANPSFADPPPHGHGGGGDDTTGTLYTAALEGAFVFGPRSVTLEGQDERLRHAASVIISRPDAVGSPELAATWDNVFSMPDNTGTPCDLFGNPGTVVVFTAPKKEKGVKGWWIAKPGGVGIRFRKIELFTNSGDPVDVGLDLIGNCAYSGGTDDSCDAFLPDPGETSEISLVRFLIHAKAAKGTPAIDGCHDGSGELPPQHSTLVITATAPAP